MIIEYFCIYLICDLQDVPRYPLRVFQHAHTHTYICVSLLRGWSGVAQKITYILIILTGNKNPHRDLLHFIVTISSISSLLWNETSHRKTFLIRVFRDWYNFLMEILFPFFFVLNFDSSESNINRKLINTQKVELIRHSHDFMHIMRHLIKCC